MSTGFFQRVWSARTRLVRYLSAGAACAILEYYLLVGLYGVIGLNVHLANFLALSGAAACNYVLSRVWIFGSGEREIHAEATLFAILVAASFAGNHLCFLLLYKGAGLDYRVAKIIAMVVVTFLNYKAKRHIVFAGSKL